MFVTSRQARDDRADRGPPLIPTLPERSSAVSQHSSKSDEGPNAYGWVLGQAATPGIVRSVCTKEVLCMIPGV